MPLQKGFRRLFVFFCAIVATTSITGQKQPNVVLVLVDEWRAQALGYNGNKDVLTPNLDKLAEKSVVFSNAIANCPVCGPSRASLLTGQHPLTTGFFMNDVQLNPESNSIGKVFKEAGYQTAFIGKWHLDGEGRSAFIPKERRQGFDYWKVLECTHNYNHSTYWDNDDKYRLWPGYDAYAQTEDAVNYIKERKLKEESFFMFLSFGPPHTPFGQAPENLQNMYSKMKLEVRKNVPDSLEEQAIAEYVGYYAHMTALDSCVGLLSNTLKTQHLDDNTVFIFTSDHGYMIHSQGWYHKQLPYEESINVPFLLRYPAMFGNKGKVSDALLSTWDIMPTLLNICNLPVPSAVEGENRLPVILDKVKDEMDAVLIASYAPFGQWPRKRGGLEYRGVRTKRYTYAKTLEGPWILFDNKTDPFQMNNLVDKKEYAALQTEMESKLDKLLAKTNDTFLPAKDYIKRWGYVIDASETVPYQNMNYRGQPIAPEAEIEY